MSIFAYSDPLLFTFLRKSLWSVFKLHSRIILYHDCTTKLNLKSLNCHTWCLNCHTVWEGGGCPFLHGQPSHDVLPLWNCIQLMFSHNGHLFHPFFSSTINALQDYALWSNSEFRLYWLLGAIQNWIFPSLTKGNSIFTFQPFKVAPKFMELLLYKTFYCYFFSQTWWKMFFFFVLCLFFFWSVETHPSSNKTSWFHHLS